MQRHEALRDLSRDHHRGLIWAKRLREAADGDREETPADAAEAFLAFWEDELHAHVTEEEHVLLPVYQRCADLAEDELVGELLSDHAWLRDAAAALQADLDEGEPLARLLSELASQLHDHVRMEDRQLFPRIEETLDEEELQAIHRRSQAFRREHRGEAAIGPR